MRVARHASGPAMQRALQLRFARCRALLHGWPSWTIFATDWLKSFQACESVVYKLHSGVDWQPPIRIELYLTRAGSPFEQWLEGLRDRVGRAKVRVQIDRL